MKLSFSVLCSVFVLACFAGGYLLNIAGLANLALFIGLLLLAAGLLSLSTIVWIASNNDLDQLIIMRQAYRYPGFQVAVSVSNLCGVCCILSAVYSGAMFSGCVFAFSMFLFWLTRSTIEATYKANN